MEVVGATEIPGWVRQEVTDITLPQSTTHYFISVFVNDRVFLNAPF